MKLFSRKALVAGAAAVALSFAGTSAAVAEETGQVTTSPAAPVKDPNNNGGSSSTEGEEPKGSSDLEAKEISAWISVFTAVIGALAAAFSFATKYLGFKL